MRVDEKRRHFPGPTVLLLEAAGVSGAVRAGCPLLGNQPETQLIQADAQPGALPRLDRHPGLNTLESRFTRKLQIVIKGLARHSPRGAEPQDFHVNPGPRYGGPA